MPVTVEEILDALRAAGRHPRRSGGWWVARCPAHPDRHPSLGVRPGARDAGAVIRCFAGCPTRAVLDALRLDPTRPAPDVPATPEPGIDRERERRLLARWRSADQRWGEPQVRYLASRGFPPDLLATLTTGPPAWRSTTWRHGHTEQPALVARIIGPPHPGHTPLGAGTFRGLHITVLDPDGHKLARRTVGTGPGSTTGAWVQLWAWPDPPGEAVLVEGIEDALAVAAATGIPAIPAGSAGALARLTPPHPDQPLIVLADPDPAGIDAARHLTDRYPHVTILTPPAGHDPAAIWAAQRKVHP